jgi:S1-C subfamily serine protease
MQGTDMGTPLYQAGVDRDDHITRLDGKPVSSQDAWDAIVSSHKPGDVVPVEFEQRGARRQAQVTLSADPQLEAVTFESVGQQPSAAEKAFRDAWLGSRAGK